MNQPLFRSSITSSSTKLQTVAMELEVPSAKGSKGSETLADIAFADTALTDIAKNTQVLPESAVRGEVQVKSAKSAEKDPKSLKNPQTWSFEEEMERLLAEPSGAAATAGAFPEIVQKEAKKKKNA